MLNEDQKQELAPKIPVDLKTLSGLVIVCRYAWKATDWLLYHSTPLTRQSYVELVNEFKPKVDMDREISHLLYQEICWGALEMLKRVDWDD